MPWQLTAKNLMIGQVSITFSAKIENFQQVDHFFSLFYQILHIFCQKLPNAWAKFTSQDLMPGHELTPEIPNARARTFVPTLIRESPPLLRMNVNTLVQVIIIVKQ